MESFGFINSKPEEREPVQINPDIGQQIMVHPLIDQEVRACQARQ
jgi:hypothetical protein